MLEYLLYLFIFNTLTLIEAQPRVLHNLPRLLFLRLTHQNHLTAFLLAFLLKSLPKLLQPHDCSEDICMDIPVNMKVFLREIVGNLYLQLGHMAEVFKVGFQLCQLPRIIRENDLIVLEPVADEDLFLLLDVDELDHDYLRRYRMDNR